MKRTTLKELKRLAMGGLAIDITSWSYEKLKDFIKNTSYEVLYYSSGVYGLNGACLRDVNNNYYVITARNSNLFMIL